MTDAEFVAHLADIIDELDARFDFEAWISPSGRRLIVAVDGDVALAVPVASLAVPVGQVVDEIACLVVARHRDFGMVH